METVIDWKEFTVAILNKNICLKYSDEILSLLQSIPNTNYKKEDFILDKKGERNLFGKWERSLIAFCNNKVAGVLIGYEREKENNTLYPKNCFYINELAVSQDFQGKGLGKFLLNLFIENCKNFKYLSGEPEIKIQTTFSIENENVINLYKKLGFCEVGLKDYPTKKDIVMKLNKF